MTIFTQETLKDKRSCHFEVQLYSGYARTALHRGICQRGLHESVGGKRATKKSAHGALSGNPLYFFPLAVAVVCEEETGDDIPEKLI